jgi:DNA repair exonuclease SbcCD ATPase subunit
VSIVKDATTNSTDVIIDDGNPRLLELASGMEKMISSLAIRVALLSASTLPKPDFLIIDEGFGALDGSNIEACNMLLLSLKDYFKNIIIISHVDAIKDVADNVIDIVRRDGHAYVKA